MKEVPLTRGYVALVDDEDYERVMQFNWCAIPCGHTVYARRTQWEDDYSKSHTVSLHRFLLGLNDPSVKVDHRNHNGLDNRRDNLRVATNAENNHNQRKRKDSTAPYKGIIFEKKKRLWRARISLGGRRVGLGRFRNPVMAARAYDEAAIKHFGRFAEINFPMQQGVM